MAELLAKGIEARGATNVEPPGEMSWRSAPERLGYCVDVRLVEETVGFSVYVAQLPGVVSEGDDAASALINIREAFLAAIESYREEQMPIPWRKTAPLGPGEQNYRVAVNV